MEKSTKALLLGGVVIATYLWWRNNSQKSSVQTTTTTTTTPQPCPEGQELRTEQICTPCAAPMPGMTNPNCGCKEVKTCAPIPVPKPPKPNTYTYGCQAGEKELLLRGGSECVPVDKWDETPTEWVFVQDYEANWNLNYPPFEERVVQFKEGDVIEGIVSTYWEAPADYPQEMKKVLTGIDGTADVIGMSGGSTVAIPMDVIVPKTIQFSGVKNYVDVKSNQFFQPKPGAFFR
jgi:hypothetical protein